MPKVHFLVRGAICFLLVFVPLSSMDQWFYNHFFRLRGTIGRPTSIVLVRVSEAKLYPPSLLGTSLLPREDKLMRSRPISVWQGRFYDQLLSRIGADTPRLVVFTSFYEWVDRVKRPLDYPNLLFSSLLNEDEKILPPSRLLTQSDNYGFANIFPDPDNVVRRSYLVYSSGASLALRTYHRLSKAPIKRNLLDPLWIDFRGPAGAYPTYDATDLLEEGSKENFDGKIVLVGRDESPSSYYETPFGQMSRLEIQANTIDSFLEHRDIRILPRFAILVTSALAVAFSIAIILCFPLTMAWLLLLLFSLTLILFALFLFAQFKLWAGIANPIFCIFGTHLLMIGYKLSRQEEQQWKLQQESANLKEMDQFKNNFISLFSHDLKTPIARIKAITDRALTEDRQMTLYSRDSLKSIDKANSELARLISDILKVTKMESMPLEPRKDVLDLNRSIEIACSRLRFLAEEKKISLVLDLEPLFSMEGDQQLIEEVITNLVENAIKYGREGTSVVVKTHEEDGDRVRVSVADQGSGIPPDEIPRVTGKFYRGRAVQEKTKGSGLGLYLAKYFVELHQGGLDIHSEVERGTTVSFWLPLPG